MTLIGYARVSTEDQTTSPQLDALRAAGCHDIFEERASGGDPSRPVLARALACVGPGDTLIVARIDRLARSLSHLLTVIEALRKKGAYFRSLGDPIDTSSPQGLFTLQVLGAAAEFERALIRERTRAGLAAAKARGRIGGNPALRARDPAALRHVAAARRQHALDALITTAETWLPIVRRLRPAHPWPEVARVLNAATPGTTWTPARLTRAVRRFVAEGLADPALLAPAPRRPAHDRLLAVIAGMVRARATLSLRAIATELEAMREIPPRGGAHWPVSSVAHLLARARAAGYLHNVTPTLRPPDKT
jgi:DNA invertase Pin-like site-specific DNA recombinase